MYFYLYLLMCHYMFCLSQSMCEFKWKPEYNYTNRTINVTISPKIRYLKTKLLSQKPTI